MYDRLLTLETLRRLEESLEEIIAWTEHVASIESYLQNDKGY